MSDKHPIGVRYTTPTALLAEARRDELLRAATQARLAAQVPRVGRRGRRVGAFLGALVFGRRLEERGATSRDTARGAETRPSTHPPAVPSGRSPAPRPAAPGRGHFSETITDK
jgi:hypothetical protein